MTSSKRTISGVDISVADEILRDLDAIDHEKTGRGRSPGRGHRGSPTDSGHSSGNDSVLEREVDRGSEDKTALLRYVEDNVVGNDTWSPGPFGERKVVYCDYTASGRSLSFIEDYITEHVHPLYANTHTTTGVMARQTTKFRKEAREIIKQCVNATDDDALIFTGSGTTGAVNKLVSALMLSGERAKKTVVLIGPYEHHSNILPWKESGAKVIRIQDDDQGMVNLRVMEEVLARYCRKGVLLIGCFSAASNVTGIVCDTDPVAALLHRYGALSFWDYATAGPYLKIDMNPRHSRVEGDCSKDAVYLSPHKFVGGVGTPGVLIAKKKLFLNAVPHSVGGGTVLYVTRETHHYVQNIEEREEGGTPGIVESIRAGLTFKVKNAIGTDLIEEREGELTALAFKRWKRNGNLIFLGSTKADRLSIFSFLIIHPTTGKMLHHNLIALLLNDLYGIQARGGCACAGPYAQDLLGIDEDLAAKFIYFLKDDSEFEKKDKKSKEIRKILKTSADPLEIMKPGFTRLNLPYFFSDEVVDYVIEAVDAIGRHGWKMASQYTCDPVTATWSHVGTEGVASVTQKSDSLHSAIFHQGLFSAPPCPFTATKRDILQTELFENALAEAERIFQRVGITREFSATALQDPVGQAVGDPDLIWFLRPHEAAHHILFPRSDPSVDPSIAADRSSESRPTTAADPRRLMKRAPFVPKKYTRGLKQRLRSAKIGDAHHPVSADDARCVIL